MLAVVLTAVGQLLFKKYAITPKIIFLFLTIFTFLITPVVSFFALKQLTIAQVYLCTAFVPVLTTLGAKLFLSEKLTKHHLIGLTLILIGTFLYLLKSF